MTARKVLSIMLKEQGLTLGDDNFITDPNTGAVLGEVTKCEYDKKGGLVYSIKMASAIDYVDLDLEVKPERKYEN